MTRLIFGISLNLSKKGVKMKKVKETFFYSKKDQCKLFYQSNLVKTKKSTQNAIIVHGALEHSGRYQELSENLEKNNINCFRFDLRGHGKSSGIQGDSPSFQSFIEDLESFIFFLTKEKIIEDYILIGHSLGGLIVLSYCLKHKNNCKLIGAYVSAPALSIKLDFAMKIKQFLARNILIYLAPKLKLPVGLNLNSISHDPEELKKYKKDPLIFNHMSVRQALGILNQGAKALEKASQIGDTPLFITHGDEDLISYKEGSEIFYKRAKSKNKKLKIYKGYYHELFNEDKKRRDVVYEDLLKWCKEINTQL